jgi:hypothetical protein
MKLQFSVSGGIKDMLIVNVFGYDNEYDGMKKENMAANIISDSYFSNNLYQFAKGAIQGNTDSQRYDSTGYTAEVVGEGANKMVKIYFRLVDDYEPLYLEPEQFEKIVEVSFKEKRKFDQDPLGYKKELEEMGGIKSIEI